MRRAVERGHDVEAPAVLTSSVGLLPSDVADPVWPVSIAQRPHSQPATCPATSRGISRYCPPQFQVRR